MATTVPITAHGVTISFAMSGFTGEIVNVTPPNTSRASIGTTHAGTLNAKTFMPGDLPDRGEFSFDVHFNPDTEPPVKGEAETITITFKQGATWVFDGFVTGYAPAGTETEGDTKISATITVKVTGDIAISGGGV